MDKKDTKSFIILITKILIIMFLTIAFPLNILVTILSSIHGGNIIENILINTYDLFILMLVLFSIAYTSMCIVYMFAKIKRKRESIISDTYIRDLPKYFPPAIASLLLDVSLETTKDYTATIAYLFSKKYLELKEDKVRILENNLVNLSSHEKYVFECVTKQKKFDHEKFTKLVVSDAENMKLIKQGRRKIHFLRNYGITLALCFIISFVENAITNEIWGTLIFLIIAGLFFGVPIYSLYLLLKYQNESFHRTDIGKIEALKWAGVKKYIKDYTLISDRSLEDIFLFGEYIPYAIALGEAKAIEKYIENNQAYRRLIYEQE